MEKKDFDNTLLPLVKRVISKTLSQELARYHKRNTIFYSEEEMMLVKSRINSENRDRKIESILEGTEYIENRLEDDPEYKEIISRYRIVLRK